MVRFVSLGFAPLLLCGSAVLAQGESGGSTVSGSLVSNRPASVNGSGRAAARQTTRQFASCAVKAHRAAVTQLLVTPVIDPTFNRLMSRVATDDCMGPGELRMPASLMRAALFEGAYLQRFARAGEANLKDVPAIDYAAGYGTGLSGYAATVVQLGRFGDCVSRADPVNARKMILSPPESGGETSSIKGLSAHLGGCVPRGVQISFSRSVLRGAVAEGLYRLTAAHAGQS